jgi:hypothetical protein
VGKSAEEMRFALDADFWVNSAKAELTPYFSAFGWKITESTAQVLTRLLALRAKRRGSH